MTNEELQAKVKASKADGTYVEPQKGSMSAQEFVAAIKQALSIPEPQNFTIGGQRDPYPYRHGSRERIRITQDTVDLIKLLHGQGMSKSEIARQTWIDNSTVGRIINGQRRA